jgi:hypothetical protein
VNKKTHIAVAITIILGLLAVLMIAAMPMASVSAQVTASCTATMTHTPYPFATTTPGPTITPMPTCPTGPIAPNWLDMSCPQATTIYSSSNCILDPVTHEVISCSGNNPFSTMDIVPPDLLGWLTKIKDTIQKVADVATKIREWYDLILVSIDTRTNNLVLRIRTLSPFPFARGAMIMFADFEWLGIIGVWLVIAMIDIAVITIIRFIISMWGIVQRIIDLIKLIPFI